MRKRPLALAVSALLAAGLVLPPSAAAQAFDVGPAQAGIARLIPGHAAQFALVARPRPASGDYFAVSGQAGRITVEGTSPAVLMTGVGWYLKHSAKVDISWPGDSVSALPAQLPAPTPFRHDAVVPHRFALNDTDDGYSGAYRDWAGFQRQIDILALHGFNEVFVQMGAEAPYYAAFQEFGYTATELRSWIPGPAHQPWWLLQNMSGFGGPVTEELITHRAALGKRIVDRLHELGMTPVLPGYFGTVPNGFAARNPGAEVVPQGDWVGFQRADWLAPTNPVFRAVAASFYGHQKRLIGQSTMYKMDLLHEGGIPGPIPVGDAARGVLTALDAAAPGATWALLGWLGNPRAEIIDAVPHERLLILDGLSDRYNGLDRETTWKGTPYAFGTIPNFGGHTTIGANTGVWSSRFHQWRTKPGSALRGVAYLPEGTGTDPAAFELAAELAWRPTPVDQRTWFADFARARYGVASPDAAAAWDALRRGPYSTGSGTWSESQDSLFTARPDLATRSSAAWSPKSLRYDPSTVQAALTSLLRTPLRDSDAYRYDVVTLARQALTNRGRALLPQIQDAYAARDITRFRSLTARWESDMLLLDELLASDPRYLLGPWLTGAKAWSMEYDARSIITTWGHRSGSNNGGLRDYAARELSGLVKDFHLMRWSKYFATLDQALVSGAAPASIDWFAVEDAWNREQKSYPLIPTGDPYALAAKVRDTLPKIPVGAVTGIGGLCVDVTSGNSTDGTPLQLHPCNGTAAQTWSFFGDKAARALNKCMDVRNGSVTAGTVVQVWECNDTPAQKWTPTPDGTLRNTKSGMCLDAERNTATAGTRLLIWPCHGGVNQRWTFPA